MTIKLVLIAFGLLVVGLVARVLLIRIDPRRSAREAEDARRHVRLAFWLPPAFVVAISAWFLLKVVLAFYWK